MTRSRHIVVQASMAPPYGSQAVEMCEHKGLGHPDTLTDGACEAACRALAAAYLHDYGTVQHFNLDKGLLIAGKSEPRFGGGTLLQRPRLIVCGRSAPLARPGQVDELVRDTVRDFIHSHLRCPRDMFGIEAAIHPGSANLAGLFGRGRAARLANDTSFGVGFAPLSELEECVVALAGHLRSAAFHT